MNRYGQASRFAYDPELLAAYIDGLQRPDCYRDAHHGRILRRWHRVSGGVTFAAAAKFLSDYGAAPQDFEAWCHKFSFEPRRR